MKYLLTIMVLYLLLTISQAWSLPTCPGSPVTIGGEGTWNNCIGTVNFEGGSVAGEFKNGELIYGTLIWADGSKYVGEFKDTLLHGKGTRTFDDGRVWKGQWRNNEWVSGKKYAAVEPDYREQQKFMVDLIAKTIKKNNSAVNSASKTRAWIKASNALCESATFDAFGLKKKWSGRVSTIDMDDDGKVNIRINIANGNSVQQYNIKNSLIDTVLDIPIKSMVQFSGYFVKGNMSENECLDGGLTASPDMLKEDFKFQFTEIESVTNIIK